jgi:hypothetical protein
LAYDFLPPVVVLVGYVNQQRGVLGENRWNRGIFWSFYGELSQTSFSTCENVATNIFYISNDSSKDEF